MRYFIQATDTLKELLLIYVVMLLVAAAVFSRAEGVPYNLSVYWAGITATSTGFGDIAPKTEVGRWVALFLTHLSILGVIPLIIIRLLQRVIHDMHQWTHEEQEQQKAKLSAMDTKLDAVLERVQLLDDRLSGRLAGH